MTWRGTKWHESAAFMSTDSNQAAERPELTPFAQKNCRRRIHSMSQLRFLMLNLCLSKARANRTGNLMRKNSASQSGTFNLRVLAAFALCSMGISLAMLSFGATPSTGMLSDAGLSSRKATMPWTAPSAPATPGSWSIVPSPNTDPTQYNQLFGVACPSASDCWAAGYYYDGNHSRTLIEHWDGSSWSIVPSPNSSTSESNFLLGITCTSATDCWAVGHHDSGDVAVFVTLIVHYDGTSWSVVNSPNVTEAQDNELRSVACTSSVDCWAVGYYSIGNPALPIGTLITQTLIEHWDGASWTVVNSPNSSQVENNNLASVTCASAANCWAVGYSSSRVNGTLTLIERYDGTSWSIVSSPNPSPTNYNVPLGVTCMSATDCWLAGYYSATSAVQSLMEHYDGASWNVVSSANTSSTQSNFPFAITCTSATDCWTAGFYFGFPGGNVYTLIDHYDGTSWSVVDSPNPPPNNAGQYVDFLVGVTCSSTTDCWAVGYYFNVNGVYQNLIEHYTVPSVKLNAVVSRKIHGSAGTFDINLPLTGTPGIECRSGGANGDYTLVFTFVNPLTRVNGASITSGTGSVAGNNIDSSDAHNYIVNLTGVTNAQRITVSLSNVTDSAGNFSSAVSASMGVLIGDTTGDGFVNSADISQTKSQSGNAVTTANFREDVNADGFINSADISLVKSKSGTALP
jgi:hypothetical protein